MRSRTVVPVVPSYRYNSPNASPVPWPSAEVHPTAYVDESAQVIGDVEIGAESSVWMNAVMRGDVNFIRIGQRSNVQDGTVVHVMHDTHPTHIGDDVTIGHARDRARLHDRRSRVLIGMGAIAAQRRDGRRGLDRRGRHARDRGHGRAAALAGDGQSRQGAPRADGRRSRVAFWSTRRTTSGTRQDYRR